MESSELSSNDAGISQDRPVRALPAKKPGFYANWGPQAWIDMTSTKAGAGAQPAAR